MGRRHLADGRVRRTFVTEGFSLVELLVSLFVMVIIVIGMAAVFDKSNQMTKAENAVSDAQESARSAAYQIVREIRMAAAGGLPANPDTALNLATSRQLPVALSLETTTIPTALASSTSVNNVNIGTVTTNAIGSAGTTPHHIRAGTDVIHIRGVITTPLYDLSGAPWTSSTGTLQIPQCSTNSDLAAASGSPCTPYVTNDLSLFSASNLASTQASLPRMFYMTNVQGVVAVGVVTAITTTGTIGTSGSSASLTLDTSAADYPYASSLNPGGAFLSSFATPIRGGFLDDRIYFIDDGSAGGTCTTANQQTSPGPCHPVLSVADPPPSGTTPWTSGSTTVTPITDDIEDLQVAYGMDFYDAIRNTGSFASPAPVYTDPTAGPYPYASDQSISITTNATFATIVTKSKSTTPPNADPSEDTSGIDKDEWIWNVSGEPGIGNV